MPLPSNIDCAFILDGVEYKNLAELQKHLTEKNYFPAKVYRHGESVANVSTDIESDIKTPLTATGKDQARELGHKFKEEGIHTIYHSDHVRSTETAEAAAAVSGAKTVELPDSGEKTAPETPHDFVARVASIKAAIDKLPPDAAVISHGEVMKAMTALDQTGGDIEEATKIYEDLPEYNNTEQLKLQSHATTKSQGPLQEGHQQTGISEHQGVSTSRQEETQPTTDNRNSGTNGPGKEIKYAVEPQKPIPEMNSEELYNYAVEVRKELKRQDKLFEGKSEAEKDAAGYYNVRDNVEDLRNAALRVNYIENSENLGELANSVKSVLKNISKTPSQETFAILNAAKRKADEMGASTNDLIKEIVKKVGNQYKDPEDAEFMMRNAFDKLITSPSRQKAAAGVLRQQGIRGKGGLQSLEQGNQPGPAPEVQPQKKEYSRKASEKVKIGKYSVFNDGGVLKVQKQDGTEPSRRVKRGIVKKYLSTHNFDNGLYTDDLLSQMDNPPSFKNEKEVAAWQLQHTTNPAELSKIFMSEQPETPALSSKEQVIADYGLGKVNRKSFAGFGDRNLFGDVQHYFLRKGKEMDIDVIAKEISDDSGMDITPEDVVSFMKRFPAGEKEALKESQSNDAIEAADKFKKLTGIELTPEVAKTIIEQEKQGYATEENTPHPTTEEPVRGGYETGHTEGQGLAANPSTEANETVPEPGGRPTTSIKNEITEAERAAAGKDPIQVSARRSMGQVWDKGKQMVDSGDWDIRNLTRIWASHPKALAPEESAALLYDRVKLHNDYKKLLNEMQGIKDDPEATKIAEMRLDLIMSDIEVNDEAARKTGYEQGLGLAIRKMISDDQYELVNQIKKMKMLNEGKDLPKELLNRLSDYDKQLSEAKTKLADYEKKLNKRNGEKIVDGLKRTIRKNMTHDDRIRERDKLKDQIRKVISKRQAETAPVQHQKAPGMQAVPEPKPEPTPTEEQLPPINSLILQLARNYFEDGTTDLDGLVGKLKDDFPELSDREIRDGISGYGLTASAKEKAQTEKDFAELKKQARLVSKIEDLQKGIKPTKIKRSLAVADKTAALKKKLSGMMKQMGVPHDAKDPLSTLKSRLNKRMAGYQQKLDQMKATGELIQKISKVPVKLDEEAINLQSAIKKIKNKYDLESAKIVKKNRSRGRKVADAFLGWRRLSLLSGPVTIGKITLAVTYRAGFTPVEELMGSVINKIPGISAIAARAPRHGSGFNLRQEAHAISEIWSKATLKDFGQIFTTGKSSLDVLYDNKSMPYEALQIAGHIHSAFKNPAKREEWRRSYEKRLAYMGGHGENIYDPMVQATAMSKAYLDAKEAVFMQDNALSDKLQRMIREMQNSKDPDLKRLGGYVLGFFLPITKVASNFVLESTYYVGGAAHATPHIINAMRNYHKTGDMGLTEEQSDFVMKNLKKQALGAALMALGWAGYQQIGGSYQKQEKQRPGQPGFGEAEFFGHRVPRWMLDSPAFTAMNFGATLHRLYDKYNSVWPGVPAAIYGIFEDVPFLNFPVQASQAFETPRGVQNYEGQMIRSTLIPMLIQDFAAVGDKDEYGRPIKRKPTTLTQQLEMGIPGLRKKVPPKTTYQGY